MTVRTACYGVIFASVFGLSACGEDSEQAATAGADLIFTNAKIYTVDSDRSWAEAVVIKDGKIEFVGNTQDAEKFAGQKTLVKDLGGRMVLPGFQDVHSHFAAAGVAYTICPLFDFDEVDAILAGIRKCAEENPDAELIRGTGWYIDQFEGGRPPRKELLDAIDSTRPLVFGDGDGHAYWMNSKAFETYGITSDTPDPDGGKIERDPETGELWGTLHEESGMNLVNSKWPAISDEEIIRGIDFAQNYYHSLGITGAQDAIVKLDSRDAYRSLPAYRQVHEAGNLKMRISTALFWKADEGPEQIAMFREERSKGSDDRLKINTVKFWADGVVETRTAMMLEPYSDQPDTSGFMMIPRETLMDAIPAVDADGFQIHVHAIGDATARYALDAFEAAWALNGKRDARHHITHLQFIHPDDIPRLKELGIGVSFQPYWAYADDYITLFTLPQVGKKRLQERTYLIGSVLRSGATVAFSSDWMVSSANPFLGMETAITRVDPHSNTGEPFIPAESIELRDAIDAYTINAAYLNSNDDAAGSVEPGKYADLVVLDNNLFEIPTEDISETKVLLTLFEGEAVYGKLDQF